MGVTRRWFIGTGAAALGTLATPAFAKVNFKGSNAGEAIVKLAAKIAYDGVERDDILKVMQANIDTPEKIWPAEIFEKAFSQAFDEMRTSNDVFPKMIDQYRDGQKRQLNEFLGNVRANTDESVPNAIEDAIQTHGSQALAGSDNNLKSVRDEAFTIFIQNARKNDAFASKFDEFSTAAQKGWNEGFQRFVGNKLMPLVNNVETVVEPEAPAEKLEFK